jgi:hypothetical protein
MSYEATPEYQQMGDWGGMVRYGNDRNLVVMFYMKSVHNPLKSMQAGVRYHDDVPYVRIHHPGERDQVIDRPVNDADKQRWPKQWMQFKNGREQVCDGTPIDMLFPSWPSIADNLRSYGVHTVEQCADMSSHAMDSIGMGAQDYQTRAKEYLEAARSGADYHKYQDEVATLKRENDRLKRDVETLSAQFGAIMGQLKAGLPVPAAMVPLAGIPGLANFQPMQGQGDTSGPTRGDGPLEPVVPQEPRKDLMANSLPQTGRARRTWTKGEDK